MAQLPNPVDIPTWLSALRARLGLSQEALAGLAGVSFVTVNRWERGRTRPSRAAIAMLVEIDEQRSSVVVGEAGAFAVRLPEPIATFVGRTAAVRELEMLFTSRRLIPLTGAPVSGKTRLALEVARSCSLERAGLAAFIDLGPLRDSELVVAELFRTLGLGPTIAGANGAIWSGGAHATNTLFNYTSILPVTAIFSWNNASQQFNFWFRGFSNPFQTLPTVSPGNYYFFQATATGGTISNTGGAATLAASGRREHWSDDWRGERTRLVRRTTRHEHARNVPEHHRSDGIFAWNNSTQQFNFWFRGFPDNFQTLTLGIERGKYYFFQAPVGATIPMN